MNLMRWNPMRDLWNLKEEMDKFFDLTLNRWPFPFDAATPRIDMYETEKEIVVKAELPGIEDKNNIEISVSEDTLSISGKYSESKEVKKENYYHSERYTGSFARTIPLPVEIKPDEVKATYKNGILEIRMPKADKGKGKRIKVDIE
ncbi:MAG: hypothetical protein PWQ91_243 [Eubacteriales bacterium]|nr:hypothetical protein [Eubacteriales bacterium]MDN5363182.1 hypothetical protein [Eubacteriales bacterium]